MRWRLDYRLDYRLDWRGVELGGAVFDGFGPAGIATLALDLEHGYTVTLGYVTDVVPRRVGTEQRIAVNDAPKQFYRGDAILFGDDARTTHATLARYAALGEPFLLGLPHEELPLVQASSGTVVYTPDLVTDWRKVGQRVLVVRDRSHVRAVIQHVDGEAVTLDVAPGIVGALGGRLQPAMPILIAPQQGFSRYPVRGERWQLDARAAIFDFVPDKARLDLGTVTLSGAFAGAIAVSRRDGLIGNRIAVEIDASATHPAEGQLVEAGLYTLLRVRGGTTTVGDVATLLEASSNVKLVGAYSPAAVVQSSDELGPVELSGGAASGDIGNGATIAEYEGHPVWDERLATEGTAGDSIHALTEILDLHGVPLAIPTAAQPDWGRQVGLRGRFDEWQWLKAILGAIRGRQRVFWLPTWRDDLVVIDQPHPLLLTIRGDVRAWYPRLRRHVQVDQVDGTAVYREINRADDNGDGTTEIELSAAVGAARLVSWLDLCRFERDEFTITFGAHGLAMTAQARAVVG